MKKLKWLLLALMASATMASATACDQVADLASQYGINLDFLRTESASPEEESTGEETPEVTPGENDGENGGENGSENGAENGGEEYNVITIAEALKICEANTDPTTERYYIRGIIDTISNVTYGEMTISDGTGSIYVYGTYSKDGSLQFKDLAERPVKGDEVLLHCTLQNYNGTIKQVKNARLIEFKSNAGNIDVSKYTEMSIDSARDAKVGDLVKVEGVVARITYADGMIPIGVYLVDGTNSIYVYSADVAGQVQIGNKISVIGEKAYWILEKEKSAASKHGYNGCNQLENAQVVSNDKGNHAFDKSWIEESTVKNITETPVSEDITTTIYKVNALVEKRPGEGFVNYYLFDIDGETGGYVYTQCNGSDFAWMDEFDGKICTVYLSAINAKSSDTACFFRYLPIEVVDEGYTFDKANANSFAIDYYGVDQFESIYTGDPALELTTSVSSELLGISGVQLSYASNNESAVYFETVGGVTTMHCGEEGEATVTVTATYEGVSYSKSVVIKVEKPVTYDYITVAEAIDADVDSEVTVKGIVGPSVVNKNGFYLFGEDGSMIAVLVSSTEQFVGLEIGHEIILKGMRERHVKNDASAFAGQTCIVNGEILVNMYGNHAYSTEKFVTDKTAAEFYALDANVDYSTTVFVFKATIKVEKTAYYTKLTLASGSTTITVYSSGAAQYSWLLDYEGQELTLEVAACNWNDKTYWAGCILAAYTEDGKLLNTLNFDTY